MLINRGRSILGLVEDCLVVMYYDVMIGGKISVEWFMVGEGRVGCESGEE